MTFVSLRAIWRRLRGPRACSLGGKRLPEEYLGRVIWGGTKEEPWPNYLSRGCPVCTAMSVFLAPDLTLDEHVRPKRPNRLVPVGTRRK